MQSRRGIFVLSGVAALLAASLYVNALHNPFVYDDYHTVAANPSIARVTDLRAIVLYDMTRPFVNFSYAVDHAVWGPGPFGFHLTNVLLHMLNVILLFWIGVSLTGHEGGALAGALLFGVHPMMTEAVGYISGRSEVLCAFFFLIALLCGRRWIRGDGTVWGLFTIGLWFATLATKEIGAMFPFVLFACDWFVAGGSAADRRRRIRTVYLPLIIIAVLLGILRLIVLARVEHPGVVTIRWDYLLIALDVLRRYVMLIVYPSGQTIFHSVPAITVLDARALLAFALIGAVAALVWRFRESEGVISFGLIWFLLLLVPSTVLTILDQGEPMAEHRTYAASAGLFLAAGAAIGRLADRVGGASPLVKALSRAGFVIVVLSLGTLTILRNRVWSDPVTLWQESVDLAPAHYRPRLLLGEALQDAGHLDEAAQQFRTAISLRPTEPAGYVKLGGNLAALGQWRAAREQFLEARRIDPGDAAARQALEILDQMESHGTNDGRR